MTGGTAPTGMRLGSPVGWSLIGLNLALLLVVTLAVFRPHHLPISSLAVVDVGETLTAALGALGCGWGARCSTGRHRRALTYLAVAAGCWSAGQAIWTLYEIVLGQDTPFPSLADVGYLGFLGFAAAGLTLLPPPAAPGERRQQVLDAATVGVAITLMSSTSTLGAVLDAGADSHLALVISVAYPVGDSMLITATLLAFGTGSGRRLQLAMVTGAMLAMTAADSAFAYLTAVGRYSTGSLVDVGWCVAFATLGVAGITGGPDGAPRPSRRRALLSDVMPYLIAAVAVATVVVQYFQGESTSTLTVVLGCLVIILVMVRQFFALHLNRRLAAAVAERENRLRHLAFHDHLTGLANRTLFMERVEAALRTAPSSDALPSVAFIDLDGFKWVNDTLGHAQGDELLVSVAARLQESVRPVDTLARLGGDEFAILFTGPHEPETMAGALVEALRTPFHVSGQRMRVSASVGVARLEANSRTAAETLLQRADIAMFTVKRSGKNSFQQYTAGMGLEAADDLTLQHALARALDDGEITVAYQPLLDLRTGRVTGVEALARWQYQGVNISPEVFVPTAERIGRAGQLTTLVLDRACTQLAAWSMVLGHHDLTLAVNISPAELSDPTLPARVAATMHRVGVQGSQLMLEVTESGLLGDPGAIQEVLAMLRALNVSLALDDFGTGYNTLAQLLSVRLDVVKVDRVFIEDIDTDPHRRAFLEAMLMLLGRLGLRTVAEGVERPGQVAVLKEMSCDMAQGYLLGRPQPAEELTHRLVDAGSAVLTPPGAPSPA